MKNFKLLAITLLIAAMACMPADLFAAKKTKKPAVVKKATPAKKAVVKKVVPAVKTVGTLAYIRLGGTVHTAPPSASLFGGSNDTAMTTKEWLNRLATARNDAKVKAVALEIATPALGLSQAIELAEAIRKLAKVKPVHTHIVAGGVAQYLLAAAGTDVAIEPEGGLEIMGVGMELSFYGDTLRKFGITPQFIQIGDYKGACEPFVNSAPSKELQGEYTKLANSLYEIMVDQIALNRNLKADAVKKAIDNGPFISRNAKRFKLVDRLIPRQLWLKSLTDKYAKTKKPLTVAKRYAAKKAKKIDFSNPLSLLKLLTGSSKAKPVPANTIAIIYGNGQIVSGKGGASLFGGTSMGDTTIIKAFNTARTNPNIKAVVFRVTSPGGSALASEMMFQAIKECAKTKPVVVSVSGMAASGGYYISCGSHKMYADESAIIGSIGVVAGRISLQKLMKDDLKVGTWTVQRGKNAGMRFSRPWTERELKVLKTHAGAVYKTFLNRVKTFRKGKVKNVNDVAQGRIFTARQALENGLIDEIGGIGAAAKDAYARAKMTGKASYLILPKPKTLADLLMGGDDEEVLSPIRKAVMQGVLPVGMLLNSSEGAQLGNFLGLLETLNKENMLMALPYSLDIK